MADIFISYASDDLPRVKPIAKALEEQGWSVWWDRSIPPGKTFVEAIKRAIDKAKCVVVLWSDKSIKSEWVQEEATIGKQHKILVPARIDKVDPPLGFELIQAAILTDWEAKTAPIKRPLSKENTSPSQKSTVFFCRDIIQSGICPFSLTASGF